MARSALHRELGVPASTPVTFELLSQLANKRVREQADLDFKQKLYHPKNDKDKRELVKDVCAMANTSGGWIICGIAEDNGTADKIVGVSLEVTTETEIHQLLGHRLDPPVKVDIRVHQSVETGTNLVAICVPDSPDKPHLMRIDDYRDTKAFQVPVRKGPSTVWLDERAIREEYRKRFALHDHVEKQHTDELDELAARASEKFPGIALIVALAPDDPLTERLNKDELRKTLQELEPSKFALPQGFSFLRDLDSVLSVGDRRYISNQARNRLHAFIEVGFDGTIGVAIQLSKHDPYLSEQDCHLYTDKLDETTQQELEFALVQAFNCCCQLSFALNPISDMTLQARLIAHGNDPIIIRRNEGPWLGSLLRPREESTPIHHFRTVTCDLQANPSREEEHEVLTDLVLEVLNQGGIETMHVLKPLEQSEETP